MKKILKSFLTVILLLTLSACSKYNIDDLKFYVIKRDIIDGMTDSGEIITVLKSDGRLAFVGSDIQGYNWQTHTVTLKENSVPSHANVTAESGGSAIFKTDDTYAFVIILKGKVVYSGGFKPGLKNPDIPLQPSICDSGSYSFGITYDPKYASGKDTRSDKKIYNFLNVCGLLSAKTE